MLVLHHGTRVCDPREQAGREVVTVLLAGLLLGKSDAGDFRFGVDRAEDGAVADDGLVTAGVPRCHLAFAEGGVGQLPVAGAIPTA